MMVDKVGLISIECTVQQAKYILVRDDSVKTIESVVIVRVIGWENDVRGWWVPMSPYQINF